METLETLLHFISEVAILFFEFVGVSIIIFSGFKGLINLAHRDTELKLKLAHGLALGLEFTLVSEILHTVAATDLPHLAVVGVIIVMRVTLTVLLHWEIKTEEDELREEHREAGNN